MARPPERPGGTSPDHETLEGEVAAVVFQNEETGFAVVSLLKEGGEPVTVAGGLSPVHPGEHLRLHGRWTTHPRFGRQFQAQWSEHASPSTRAGIERYLGSGAFPGVGPEFAKRLVAHFGETTLQALGMGERTLRAVPGIGPKRAAALAAGFREGHARHRVLAEMRGFGLSGAQARALYESHGAEAVDRVRRDPYALVGALRGIGFRTADRIAGEVGIERDSEVRARGVVLHLLREGSREGHSCLPEDLVLEQVAQLGISDEHLVSGTRRLVEQGRMRLDEPGPTGSGRWWYLPELLEAETGCAAAVRQLLDQPAPVDVPPEQVLAAVAASAMRPDPSQRAALELALGSSLCVLTGGPGTGKTTTLRLFLDILERAGVGPVRLASPTGRAAKRLQEATGREASTVHRLLGFDPMSGGFRHDEEEPLDLKWLVVDEVSMLDLPLAHALLRAVPDGARVLLVGDADQLPPVGPGAVLADLVGAPAVPTARLERVHRQGEDSGITEAAHAILHGEMPEQLRSPGGDFFVSFREDADSAMDLVERLVAERMPERYGIDPLSELLVLSPMYRGPLGVDALNERLGARLNADAAEGPGWARGLRAGDRVMVVRNDYDREVFNGDAGRVVEIGDSGLVADIDGRAQHYGPDDIGDLIPAYCVTVHRAQGSEARAVLVVLGGNHWPMLRRNLLYTAVTRGRELVVVVASRAALRRAVQNAEEAHRHGRLRARLAPAAQPPDAVPAPRD